MYVPLTALSMQPYGDLACTGSRCRASPDTRLRRSHRPALSRASEQIGRDHAGGLHLATGRSDDVGRGYNPTESADGLPHEGLGEGEAGRKLTTGDEGGGPARGKDDGALGREEDIHAGHIARFERAARHVTGMEHDGFGKGGGSEPN